MRTILLVFALTSLIAAPAAAQQLTVAFHDGLVSVDATSVPVRTILNEWAKQGGTKVVGVERVTGAPLTVKLIDVPEAKALEVILRSAAGYMAAPRSTGAGPSIYDRILVMATSSTPASSSPSGRPTVPQPNPAFNGTQRFIPPQRQMPDNDEEKEEDPTPPNPPVFTFPGAPGGQPTFPNANGGQNFPQQMQPMIINPATGGAQPQIAPGYPSPAPFGSSTPGMINAPPPQPGQRPPGGRQER